MLGASYSRFDGLCRPAGEGEGEGEEACINGLSGPSQLTTSEQTAAATATATTTENGTGTDAAPEAWRRASAFYAYDPDEHEVEQQLGFLDPSNPPVPGCNLNYIQWRTRRFVEHFIVRLLTFLLIIVDMVVLFVDVVDSVNPTNDPLEYCALAFSTYFVIEVTLRIFGLGPALFFRAWYNMLDFLLVVVTFILSIVTVSVESITSNAAGLIVILRIIRLARISRIIWQQKHIKTGARQFISQNKRRYQQEGFDLDLTYVTPNVIAMSFPSAGKMSMYRNDIREVGRFLDHRHKNHYRVYNLCSERHYDEDYFHGAVIRYHIDDHNVPALQSMLEFSENVREFQAMSPDSVIAVHCKGGKGRTGTMICVCLIDSGAFKDAEMCLGYFGDRRTDKNAGKQFQGVETPSQSRYVGYYERVVTAGRVLPPSPVLRVTGITFTGMTGVGTGTAVELTVTVGSRNSYMPYRCSFATDTNCKRRVEGSNVQVSLLPGPEVTGDTKVMFTSSNSKIPKGYDNCPFFFWFHTAFIVDNKLELSRQELDNPHKSKTWHVFKEDFGVTFYFEPIVAAGTTVQ